MQWREKYFSIPFRIAGIVVLLFISGYLQAQDGGPSLSMEEALHAALAANPNITLAQLDEKIASSNYQQTGSIFLPQVNFSYSAFISNNPLNAFGFKLQQQVIEGTDFVPKSLNHPDATPDFMTQFSVVQPILNMDQVYQRKSALKQTEVYRYKTQRTKEWITWQVKQVYLQLQLARRSEKVFEEALATARSFNKFTNDRYNQGLVLKSDLLNTEVGVRQLETRLAEAKSAIADVSDLLSLLMNKPMGNCYSPDSLRYEEPAISTDTALASRADFRAMLSGLQSYQLNLKSSRMSYLPRINSFANYQLHDKSMFGFGGNGYFAGIQLSYDIFKGLQNKNKINGQKLEYQKLQEQLNNQLSENRAEINKVNRQLADADFKIRQQEQSVDQASEALRILENRYRQGLVNTTDVLQAQTQLSQQQLGLAQALFARNAALVYLEYLNPVKN